jgi:hypothetical protein
MVVANSRQLTVWSSQLHYAILLPVCKMLHLVPRRARCAIHQSQNIVSMHCCFETCTLVRRRSGSLQKINDMNSLPALHKSDGFGMKHSTTLFAPCKTSCLLSHILTYRRIVDHGLQAKRTARRHSVLAVQQQTLSGASLTTCQPSEPNRNSKWTYRRALVAVAVSRGHITPFWPFRRHDCCEAWF